MLIAQQKYLLILLHAFGSAIAAAHKVLRAFPDYTTLLAQSDMALHEFGLDDKQISNLRQPPYAEIDAELEWRNCLNQHIIFYDGADYPPLLREIYAPPLVLFVKGERKILFDLQLAIVGSRNPTAQGAENAYAFAKSLAQAGLSIASGLALGIDAHAHRGALAAKQHTLAVLGCGLNRIYPKNHAGLAAAIIAEGGALISEFPLQALPLAHYFPQRNRIISGLSLGVLVIEAALKSGSLITARMANEQGREVFALPGSIHNPLARGCHVLISQGAKLIENVDDILSELAALEIYVAHANINKMREAVCKTTTRDKNHEKILACIDEEDTALDVIAARCSLTIDAIMTILLHLELQGAIVKSNFGYMKVTNK